MEKQFERKQVTPTVYLYEKCNNLFIYFKNTRTAFILFARKIPHILQICGVNFFLKILNKSSVYNLQLVMSDFHYSNSRFVIHDSFVCYINHFLLNILKFANLKVFLFFKIILNSTTCFIVVLKLQFKISLLFMYDLALS